MASERRHVDSSHTLWLAAKWGLWGGIALGLLSVLAMVVNGDPDADRLSVIGFAFFLMSFLYGVAIGLAVLLLQVVRAFLRKRE